jgi:inner membrane protein
MLSKTHLAINFFFAMFFSAYAAHKAIFIALVLFATLLPDIDLLDSYIGKRVRFLSRIITFFSRHRQFFHSLPCTLIISFLLFLLSAEIALAFFIGYSLHILADSFTREGIQIFWPLKARINGMIRTDGWIEKIIFFAFVVADMLYLIYIF